MNTTAHSAETVKPATLIECLHQSAGTYPDKLAYTFLVDGKTEGKTFTYSQLDRRARAVAALLQQHQAKGERALLLYPQGLEVIAAFCGCLYAGVIAIPVPPPEAGRLKRTLPRLTAIVKDAQATLVLTIDSILQLVEEGRSEFSEFAEFDSMRWIDTEQIDDTLADQWQDPQIDGHSLAYLQYTSGSTSTPKGVMLTHKNLMHHCGYLQRACGYTPESVSVTWMPYFHDYGLVEGITVPLYNNTPCYLMSPFSFIKRPLRWLGAISRYKGTHSQAPNFAYDLCTRRIKPKQIAALDLSSWEAAGNAAEPINPKVMEKFYGLFSDCGFRWNAFAPAYGLAENTLLVSTKPKLSDPVLFFADTAELEKNRVVASKPDRENARAYVSCGKLVCETQVAIVNPDTFKRCASNEVGEIWVSDPSVADGYWKRPDATKETFQARIAETDEGPFLRTGDLGFMKDGELFITGRIKDLIIIRGTNHYPQDIEWTAQQVHSQLRPDYGAAFSIEVRGEEQLVVVQEVERRARELEPDRAIADIRQAIAEEFELQTYAVVLAKPGNILKTASGKVQRRACKANFLAGTLTAVADWSEDPKLTSKYRDLQGEVESLAAQVKKS
ncbi:MAG: fatty acyl-AMP ligase [Cyanobacteriota bacterium]|nr:fatty acyl-AMP ligase [Cyanobacteriota bacterium]